MAKLFNKIFPFWQIRNVAMFYVLSAVYNSWFVAGVWVFIWGRFMTQTQVGISDAFTFAIGLLVELPSGVFADVIGRKKAIIIGNLLLVIGNFLISMSSSFLGITAWYLVWTIGYAFQSGATEALVYDAVRQEGLENEWHKIISASTVIGKIATLLATAAGGFLFVVWFRLPYLIFALSGIVGVVAAFLLKEIQVQTKPETQVLRTYITQMKDGISVLARRGVFPMALLSLSVMGIAYMYNWGLLRPLTGTRFGYSPKNYALLLSVTSLFGIITVSFLPKIKELFSSENLLKLIGGLFALFFFLMGFQYNWILGGLIMILISILLLYMEIIFSQFINLHTRPEHRATTLSTVALFTRLPYVLLAVVIGKLADSNLLPQYTLIVGGIAILLWFISVFLQKKQEKISLV